MICLQTLPQRGNNFFCKVIEPFAKGLTEKKRRTQKRIGLGITRCFPLFFNTEVLFYGIIWISRHSPSICYVCLYSARRSDFLLGVACGYCKTCLCGACHIVSTWLENDTVSCTGILEVRASKACRILTNLILVHV